MADPAYVRTPPRLLRVRRIQQLTPAMRRITLAGDALEGFPADSDGAHIKLLLPREGQTEPVLPTLGPHGPVWPPAGLRPLSRTYTVSRYDLQAGELDVDFVLHGENGPASRWALRATLGAAIGVAGPGGPALYHENADWYLLIGDSSSLALLAAVLRRLPDPAQGTLLIEVATQSDCQTLPVKAGITQQWLLRGSAPARQSTLLIDAVQQMPWRSGIPSVTLAGENTQVVAIRNYILNEKAIPRRMMYAVPYWKDTYTEEAYHAERHRIMDEME